jgi:hypothetical protein
MGGPLGSKEDPAGWDDYCIWQGNKIVAALRATAGSRTEMKVIRFDA